jgi:hypothetical protein
MGPDTPEFSRRQFLGVAGMPPDTNMTFGTLRYGSLLESVLYDCRRFVDYKGELVKALYLLHSWPD